MLQSLGTFLWLAVAGGPLTINPSLIWLVAGALLCLMELALPTAFTAFTMGFQPS